MKEKYLNIYKKLSIILLELAELENFDRTSTISRASSGLLQAIQKKIK